MDRLRTPETEGSDAVHTQSWVLVLGVILLGALILAIAIEDEPYNIDELRQTRLYEAPILDVLDQSYALVQPPLDPVLNALTQRVIGVGDVQQRLLSVVFGIGSLTVVGLLGLRSGFGGLGAASAVLVLAISPLMVSISAYARPYALPLLLILVYVFAADVWLKDRRAWSAIALPAVALMLPFSRTGEPIIALASSMLVLAAWWFARRPNWQGSVWLPISAAAVGLVVGIPNVVRLQRVYAGEFRAPEALNWGGFSRFVSDLPSALAEVFAPWPIASGLVLVAFLSPRVRRLLVGLWWFWPLVLTAIGFAVMFVLRTAPSQIYVSRYTFSWWPPFAVCLGACVSVAADRSGLRDWHRLAIYVLTGGLVLMLSFRLVIDLTTEEGTDWSALSDAINRSAPDGATVLFEAPRPFGAYRTVFAGSGRYLDPEHRAPTMANIVQRPDTVTDSAPIVVALLDYAGDTPNWPIEVQGWHRFDSGNDASLFLSVVPLHGSSGARTALLQFSGALDRDRGAAMALAAAALAAHDGDLDDACQVLEGLIESGDDSLIDWIQNSLARAGKQGQWANQCAA